MDVDCSETLYRTIKRSKPESIGSGGKVSSALFKEPIGQGISVDRDGGRQEAEIIEFIKCGTFKGRTKGVCSVDASYCFDIEADVKSDPTPLNMYHANIFFCDDEKKRNLQALKLADHCRLVYWDEEMKWVM